MTPKLTPAQRRVLATAAVDAVCGSNSTNEANGLVHTRVADTLTDRGLLEKVGWDGRRSLYRITAAGRNALEADR